MPVASTLLRASKVAAAAAGRRALPRRYSLLTYVWRLQQETSSDDAGRTALHVASSRGQISVVKFLVDRHAADVLLADSWKGTPLDDAIRHDRKDVVEFLLSKGALPGGASLAPGFPAILCQAASQGNVSCLKGLARRRVDLNRGDAAHQRSALHLAASEGQLAVVQCLVEELKVDVNMRDRFGGTPLDYAQLSRNQEVIGYLKFRSARPGMAGVVSTKDACDLRA
ncbi:unnamed protein product, partial [Polarella glacialis]